MPLLLFALACVRVLWCKQCLQLQSQSQEVSVHVSPAVTVLWLSEGGRSAEEDRKAQIGVQTSVNWCAGHSPGEL